MKRRIIKGQAGLPGLKPITRELADSIWQAELSVPYDEPWWAKTIRYVLNPFDIASDYVENSDWAPSWLKRAAPWASFAAGMAAGGPKNPKGPKGTKLSNPTPNVPKKRGRAPRHDAPAVTLRRRSTLTKEERTKLLIEAGGNPFDRSSGALRVDQNGNFTRLDDVGRPVSSEYKRTPYGQSIYEKYLEMIGQKSGATEGAAEGVPVEANSAENLSYLVQRGRPSKAAQEAKKQKFLTEGYMPPKRSLIRGNGIRSVWNDIHYNINLLFDELASLRQRIKGVETRLGSELGEKRKALLDYIEEINTRGWDKNRIVYPEGWDDVMQITHRANRVKKKKKKK